MKQITIISGKGGTGKTTLVASFAALAENIVIADCDVDAPDLHLLLHPEIVTREEFKGLNVAAIDKSKCIECGICEEAWSLCVIRMRPAFQSASQGAHSSQRRSTGRWLMHS
jgi:MinD superfamily P-loop ATPase